MPEIEIRPAALTDLSILSNLDSNYQSEYVWQMDRTFDEGQTIITFRDVRLPRIVRVEPPHRLTLTSEDTGGNSIILAARMMGELVGYIRIVENQIPGVGWMTDLVVHQEIRRHGIGSALIWAGQDWAASKGFRRLICDVQSKNHAAIRLMFKLGYEFCGYNDYYYANKDIALFFTRFLR